MNNFKLGKFGEDIVHKYFKNKNYQIQSPDFFVYSKEKDDYICIEVKFKNKKFRNQFLIGHGLDINQIYLRNKLYNKTKIKTFLIIVDNESKKIYGQYLNILENGKYFDTKNKIRIYDLNNYSLLKNHLT